MLAASAVDAAWTCPLIILAALLISWAAESAQYRISQGLALAVVQILWIFAEVALVMVGIRRWTVVPAMRELARSWLAGNARTRP